MEIRRGTKVVRLTVDAELPYVEGRLYVNGGEDATLQTIKAKTYERAVKMAEKLLAQW